MSRRPGGAAALLAVVALTTGLVGCSTAYHAGDQAAREWASWVKDHPIAGARVTEAVGTNVQPFHGTFEAYARLTVEPSEKAIVRAMASMCRFDDETDSRTTYWLQIDRVSLQAPCRKDEQEKVARFWHDVRDLSGIEELAFSTKGIALTATDATITSLTTTLSEAADATGHANAGSVNDYASPHVSITQGKGVDLGDELGLAQGVLDTAGADVVAVRVVRGRVSAATSGSVAQAQEWQQSVGHGSALLTVTPAKVTTEVPLSADGRALLERLSEDSRVTALAVNQRFWSLDTPGTDDARGLLGLLDDAPGTRDLGELQMDVGTEHYDGATGEGRSCYLRPLSPEEKGSAEAFLDLCDVPNAVNVDDRFDAGMDLRLHGDDLDHAGVRDALACLKKVPAGLSVTVQLPQNDTLTFTTGAKLVPEFPQSDLGKRFVRIWDSLS